MYISAVVNIYLPLSCLRCDKKTVKLAVFVMKHPLLATSGAVCLICMCNTHNFDIKLQAWEREAYFRYEQNYRTGITIWIGIKVSYVTLVVHLYCSFSLWRQMALQQSAKFRTAFLVNFVPVWGRIASPIMHRFGRCFRRLLEDQMCFAMH